MLIRCVRFELDCISEMATVTNVFTSQDGVVLYEVEESNWSSPSVLTFDEREQIPLTNDTIIDVVLLGEGYYDHEQASFEAHLSSWYDNTFAKWPYSQFINAFRVQGVFTPSDSRANDAGDGYYGITLNEAEGELAANVKLDMDTSDLGFREKLYDILAFVRENGELNVRVYPDNLIIGRSGDEPDKDGEVNSPRNRNTYRNLMRNCVVAIAVRDPAGKEMSGFYRQVTAPPAHSIGEDVKVAVAFGRGYQHEFSHAFGLMLDEYIEERGSFATGRQQPSALSVFEVWNLAYTVKGHQVPWFHISPSGLHPRPPHSRVGQMWLGGRKKEKGVWHSEYRCQMNGRHQNYFSRTDEADQFDPKNKQVFAGLRSSAFCIWCEEILTIKILEKTDGFLRFEDVLDSGGDINQLGRIWYRRWVDELRSRYWVDFDLVTRINDREAYYNHHGNHDNPPYFDGNLDNTNLMKKVKRRERSGGNMLLWAE